MRPAWHLLVGMVFVKGNPHYRPTAVHEVSDPHALRAALLEAGEMINAAHRPVILADVEVHRFGLQDEVLKLVKKTSIPIAATVLGKSVVGEQHPLYLGIYEGAMGRENVREYACLLI